MLATDSEKEQSCSLKRRKANGAVDFNDAKISSYDPQTGKELEKVTLKVLGMTCASCVSSIERNISKVEGLIACNK